LFFSFYNLPSNFRGYGPHLIRVCIRQIASLNHLLNNLQYYVASPSTCLHFSRLLRVNGRRSHRIGEARHPRAILKLNGRSIGNRECLSFRNHFQRRSNTVPLTEIAQFVPPDLQAGGTTHLGAAIKLLMDCIEREVNKSTAQVKGDWKPLIFIMSDGDPSDDHRAFANELKTRRYANIIALACGDAAPANALKDITESVLQMRDMSPGAFKQFFKWVSQSIKQTSQKCSASPNDVASGISLPPPPQGITIVP